MSRHSRRRGKRDRTPVTVDIADGTLVYWEGKHRDGRLHGVPKYLAMRWLRYRWATVVYEPARVGAASNAADMSAQDAAKTASIPRESDDLRGTDPDHPAARHAPGRGRVPRSSSPSPRRSVKNGLYGSLKIADSNDVAAQQDSFSGSFGSSTGSNSNRTGSVRVCPNCSKPVDGRRKWCSESCRLQAYRGRGPLAALPRGQ